MIGSIAELTAHLLRRLGQVQRTLGIESKGNDPDTRFVDALDSMGMVEFLGLLADDLQVETADIERCVEHRFGTVAELAAALHARSVIPEDALTRRAVALAPPSPQEAQAPFSRVDSASNDPAKELDRREPSPNTSAWGWLAATAVSLPRTVQSAVSINEILNRPAGWLESHAGIRSRRIWAECDPVAAAVDACRVCLDQAGARAQDVGALLVTSEAPPMLAGLAAALHHGVGLRADAVALEVGGACTGFLMAMWTAQALLQRAGMLLLVTVEAPSRYLAIQPGSAGEAAALFGDAAAASLVCAERSGREGVPLGPILLGSDGGAAHLLRVDYSQGCAAELHMEGPALAGRAVRAMAYAVQRIAAGQGIAVADLHGVVAHGGNGRMPALLARQLGLPAERVWSEVATTGNLGSASLPVAWALRTPRPAGPVVCVAVGAGLTWGALMVGS